MENPSSSAAQELQHAFSTADLYDEHHTGLQVCDTEFRSFGLHRSFYGRCSTVTTFEDHTPVLKALETKGEGRVLVVDGQGSRRTGLLGDKLAAIAVENGWSGVIINGVIRDSLAINELDLGVKALGATARRGWAQVPSDRDLPFMFGSVRFTPGDWIYADSDCVILSKSELTLPKA